MSQILITNADLILKDRVLRNSSLLIRNGKIEAIGRKMPRAKDIMKIDARGCYVSPGLIDIHIHGDPAKILRNELKFGTTGVVIAESCSPLPKTYEKVGRIRKFIKKDPLGRAVLGVRLEGPYISKEKAGAQDKRYIRSPRKKELLSIIKKTRPLLKIMTIAPEVAGAKESIKTLKKKGIIPSAGHTNSTCEVALGGIRDGITHATHLFNAMSGKHDLKGCVGACLDSSKVTVELITDLIHVSKKLINIVLKRKRQDKIILVTDSIRYTLNAIRYTLKDVYRTKNGTIAGSGITMMDAVRNLVKTCRVPIGRAVRFAALNPAKLLGVDDKRGSIAAGKDADLAIFDKKFKVKMVLVHGKIVHQA